MSKLSTLLPSAAPAVQPLEDRHGRGALWLGLRGSGRSLRLALAADQAEKGGFLPVRLRLAAGIPLSAQLGPGLPAANTQARQRDQRLALFIDDLHRIGRNEALALTAALDQESRAAQPVLLVATALPSLWSQLGPVIASLQRHLRLVELPPLEQRAAAAIAIAAAESRQKKFAAPALLSLLARSEGSPALLLAWTHHAAELAGATIIREADVAQAEARVHADLDADFHRDSLTRLNASERAYLLAMAELGAEAELPGLPGQPRAQQRPVEALRSGDIAARLGRRVTQVAPVRALLMSKHLLYAPRYGHTAFTTPGYGGFVRRSWSAASMSSAISAGASLGA